MTMAHTWPVQLAPTSEDDKATPRPTARPLPPPLTTTDHRFVSERHDKTNGVSQLARDETRNYGNCAFTKRGMIPAFLVRNRSSSHGCVDSKHHTEGNVGGLPPVATPSSTFDSMGIMQTFNEALDNILDKRIKDLEKTPQTTGEESFDVFDKWLEGNSVRRYRPDNPNAVHQRTGWVMNQISLRDNVVEKVCEGVIVCTSCHTNDLTNPVVSNRRMKPAYQPAPYESDRYKLSGKKCPEKGCNGVLMHRRCRGYLGKPVIHRWHTFNDAIVLESLGIHDHPRPIKEYPDADLAPPTAGLQSGWQNGVPQNIPLPQEATPCEQGANSGQKIEQILSNEMKDKTRFDGINKNHPNHANQALLPNESDVTENTILRPGDYALTMGIVGCLPDNVQRAMKSFSIKPEKQHITFSFPYMADIIRQTALLSSTQAHAPHHMTPMLFCDHSLSLMDGFDVVLTLATDLHRCVVCVVLITLYQSGSKEGPKQHYATLLKTILEGLPPGLSVASNLKLPTLVLLSDDCDPDDIATCLADTLMSVHGEEFLATATNPNECILGLKENIILPCIISRPYAFRLAVTDVTSKLPDQDTERFVALAQYLLSDKCSEPELKKTDLLLKVSRTRESYDAESHSQPFILDLSSKVIPEDPAFVPPIVRQFWTLWGHELVAPKIFPVAKAQWDSDIDSESRSNVHSEDNDVIEEFLSWQAIFAQKSSRRGLSFRDILQRLVQTLKAQGPNEEVLEPKDSKRHTSVKPCSSLCEMCESGSNGILNTIPNGGNTATAEANTHFFQHYSLPILHEGVTVVNAAKKREHEHFSHDAIVNMKSFQGPNTHSFQQFGKGIACHDVSSANSAGVGTRLLSADNEMLYPSLFNPSKSAIRQPARPILPQHTYPIQQAPPVPPMVPNMYSQVHHQPLATPRRDYCPRVHPRTAPYYHMQKLLSLADNRNRMHALHVRNPGSNVHMVTQFSGTDMFVPHPQTTSQYIRR